MDSQHANSLGPLLMHRVRHQVALEKLFSASLLVALNLTGASRGAALFLGPAQATLTITSWRL